MRPAVGGRVVAISHSTNDEVFVFGLGVYLGDEVPGPEAGGFAALARDLKRPNPKIQLDSGEIVWGGECWWGPEESFEKDYGGGRKIVMVSVADARSQKEP